MKVLFVGPSLPDAKAIADPSIDIRPPACQGDVMTAIRDGARVIGLIDGQFEFAAPVWHKELLFALSQGIVVLGAASMGALRAAECAPFGMIGVGKIYEDYITGRRVDDADVAVQHGPAELFYPSLTVPMVNIDATLVNAQELGLLTEADRRDLSRIAGTIFFKDRSWRKIADVAGMEWGSLRQLVQRAWVDQKRMDALHLLETMSTVATLSDQPCQWQFNSTPIWRKMYP